VPEVAAWPLWSKSSPRFRCQRAAALALACVLGLMLLTACEQRERDVSAAVEEDSVRRGPSQVSWSVRFALQESGKRRAHFVADRMAQIETDDSTYVELTMQPEARPAADSLRPASTPPDAPVDSDTLTGIGGRAIPSGRVVAYVFEEGDSSAVITAERMLYFAEEGRFEAFGDVEVNTVDDKQLQSEHLTWDQDGRTIRTRRFVRIITPTEDVQGNGLVADEDLDSYQIGRFTANVDIDDEENAEQSTEQPTDPNTEATEPAPNTPATPDTARSDTSASDS
jgi:hypothetical protein